MKRGARLLAALGSALVAAGAVASVLAGCKGAVSSGSPVDDPPETPASPQAKAEPAPLANIPSNGAAGAPIVGPDGGSPPLSLRTDRPLSADTPTKEATCELEALLHAGDVPPPPKAPEINTAGLEAARKKTEPRLVIDWSATRARMILASSGFVLPAGTELRARVDRYGHVVLSPEGLTYRVAAPGALRALLGERRLDVAPVVVANVLATGAGARRLGRPTHKFDVVTRAAHASFELAKVAESGEGGALICRALLDLMNASPTTPLCAEGDVPLHAELHWTTRGAVTFDAVSLVRKTDLPLLMLAAPPSNAAFDTGLPPQGAETLLSPAELGAFRSAPLDVPATGLHVAAGADPVLTLGNSTDELRFVWIDGVPAAWLAPGARIDLRGFVRGRYTLEWRTFLGDSVAPRRPFVPPDTSEVGGADGGAL